MNRWKVLGRVPSTLQVLRKWFHYRNELCSISAVLRLALALTSLSETKTPSGQTFSTAFTWQEDREFRRGLIAEMKANNGTVGPGPWNSPEKNKSGRHSFSTSSHVITLTQAGNLVFFSTPFSREAWTFKCKWGILSTLHNIPGNPQEPSQTADKIPSWERGGTRTSVFPFICFHFAWTQSSGSETHGLQPSEGFNQPLEHHIILSQKEKIKTKQNQNQQGKRTPKTLSF